ncbi:putative MATE family efflux protein [Polymorphobacter fuscus]|uniref:MATE family efflux transporter n=2 Tax=Sandarakinorhabdus fusca TaxID=1439888 RepID=A0A7C9GX52_9SPHN|nr:MATE family efflux transporter [Polymorphobacter fuscus]KAB7648016.1 MATE family efflux transporter [Polymorphobacter fuscus]MQT16994.1 MATE family efflux transporter [Polymorphobacter fuscus]NJC09015.1 putative MATE family efflux protein [Polymorphobacter fuscus]
MATGTSADAPAAVRDNPLLSGPLLPALMRLALPNMGAMVAGSVAAIAETAYVGRLGVPALAGMAVVFPLVMLQAMLSAGAIGSGVSAAIARSLGAGDTPRAEALAVHALWIGVIAGGVTSLVLLPLAPLVFGALGAKGAALDQAVAYARVAFIGSIGVWTVNLLAAVLRGAGNMAVPSTVLLLTALLQIVIGGTLGLGLGPVPRLGMAGVAAGQLVAYAIGSVVLLVYLRAGRAGIAVPVGAVPPTAAYFAAILRTGATAAVSPIMSIATIVILNRLVAGFGPTVLAGFGIGTRLEFLLTPLSFAIGVASVPLVGTAIGAGMVPRARAATWTAARLAAAVMAAIGLMMALVPGLWVGIFTSDAPTVAAASQYFHFVGPTYGFFGAGMSLFFSALAAGKVAPMLLAGALRLGIVAVGGTALVAMAAPVWMVFALIGAGIIVYGAMSILVVWRADWTRR